MATIPSRRSPLRGAIAASVFTHGAGAGMSPSRAAAAEGLAPHKIATLRYWFLYMEQRSRRPDRPALAEAAVRKAATLAPRLPSMAGGKSFGGRMTSQAQARDPLPKVRGLAFLGFPLHIAKKLATKRAEHQRSGSWLRRVGVLWAYRCGRFRRGGRCPSVLDGGRDTRDREKLSADIGGIRNSSGRLVTVDEIHRFPECLDLRPKSPLDSDQARRRCVPAVDLLSAQEPKASAVEPVLQ